MHLPMHLPIHTPIHKPIHTYIHLPIHSHIDIHGQPYPSAARLSCIPWASRRLRSGLDSPQRSYPASASCLCARNAPHAFSRAAYVGPTCRASGRPGRRQRDPDSRLRAEWAMTPLNPQGMATRTAAGRAGRRSPTREGREGGTCLGHAQDDQAGQRGILSATAVFQRPPAADALPASKALR